MITIDSKYQQLLLEAVEEYMYKLSLQLETHKGGPLTKERKELTKKQSRLEELQHTISSYQETEEDIFFYKDRGNLIC